MINMAEVNAHRDRALSPDNPFIRGTAQNPDVFFQNREAANVYYDKVPGIIEEKMEQFASLTGRRYKLFDYYGHDEPDRIIIIMGSGGCAVQETIDYLRERQAFGKPLLWLFGSDFTAGYPAMFVVAIGLLARSAIGPVERDRKSVV